MEKVSEWLQTVARMGYSEAEWERLPAMDRCALLDKAGAILTALLPDVLAYGAAQIADEIKQAAVEAGGHTPNGIGFQMGLRAAVRIALGED